MKITIICKYIIIIYSIIVFLFCIIFYYNKQKVIKANFDFIYDYNTSIYKYTINNALSYKY